MATWIALESNPDVMNKYIQKLGVGSKWSLMDVFGLEPDQLEWIPKPVKAVILLCPCSENFDKEMKEKDAQLQKNPPVAPKNLFYMKQYIHNACGAIALVHSIANNPDIELAENSILKSYLNKARDLSPEERGKLFQEDTDFSEAHQSLAAEGQTNATEEQVNHHFIALVNVNNELFELGGSRMFPISHGPTTAETLLEDAAKVCKAAIERESGDVRFSVLALTCSLD